jgi:hypothetical protein
MRLHAKRGSPGPSLQVTKHSVDNVWGAACAAQRINGSYVKETQHRFDENTNTTVVVKQRNRDIMQTSLPTLLYSQWRILH